MVTLIFKLLERDKEHLSLSKPEKFDTVLSRCSAGEELLRGGYIAVREGKVITGKSLIEDGDTIHIFPPLSGG